MPTSIPKIPSVKEIKQFAKDPRTYWKIFNQLFPLGVGGLRPQPETQPYDFLKDISVPYDYQSTSPGFQTPIFGEPLGEPEPYLEPSDRPQPTKPKEKEKEKTGEPPLAPTLPLEDVPRPDDLVEDVPPVHPVEQSDEAEDEGEPKEPRQPRRRSPEYDVYNCATLELLTGIPCDRAHAKIQIQTPKIRPNSKARKTYSSRSHGYNTRQKNISIQADYSRRNLSRLRQRPDRTFASMYRSTRRRTDLRWYSHRRYTSLF